MKTVVTKGATIDQLIKNAKSLRQAVIRSPFTSELDALGSCSALIKLDISGNRLDTLPSLAKLVELRVLHLHNNLLARQQVEQQFRNGRLQKLIWVTLWGNLFDSDKLRHRLVNSTGLRAVNQQVVHWSEQTSLVFDCQFQFDRLRFSFPIKLPEEGSPQASIKAELQLINKLYFKHHVVIRLQRAYRRHTQRSRQRGTVVRRQSVGCPSGQPYFSRWQLNAKLRARLRDLLRQRGKEHYLFQRRQFVVQECNIKMRELAVKARERVAKRKQVLKNNLIIFRCLSRHSWTLLYQRRQMHFQLYPILLVSKALTWPVQQLLRMAGRIVGVKEDQLYYACLLQQDRSMLLLKASSGGSINTVAGHLTRTNSTVIEQRGQEPRPSPFFQRMRRGVPIALKRKPRTRVDFQKLLKSSIKLNDRYQRYHDLQRLTFKNKQLGLCFLRLLSAFNRGAFPLDFGKRESQPLFLIFYYQALRISACVKIQKKWRHYRTARQINPFSAILRKRAATKLQRFFRGLSWQHLRQFKLIMHSRLSKFKEQSLYISSTDYGGLMTQKSGLGLTSQVQLRVSGKQVYPVFKSSELADATPLPNWMRSISVSPGSGTEADIYCLLHTGAAIRLCEVEGSRFIEFRYEGLAKVRAYLYSLYKYRLKGRQLSLLLTSEQIKNNRPNSILRHTPFLCERPFVLSSFCQANFGINRQIKYSRVSFYTQRASGSGLRPIKLVQQFKIALKRQPIEQQAIHFSAILPQVNLTLCQIKLGCELLVKKQFRKNVKKETVRRIKLVAVREQSSSRAQSEHECPRWEGSQQSQTGAARQQRIIRIRTEENRKSQGRRLQQDQAQFQTKCNTLIKNYSRIKDRISRAVASNQLMKDTRKKYCARERASLKTKLLRQEQLEQKLDRYRADDCRRDRERSEMVVPRRREAQAIKHRAQSIHGVFAQQLYPLYNRESAGTLFQT